MVIKKELVFNWIVTVVIKEVTDTINTRKLVICNMNIN